MRGWKPGLWTPTNHIAGLFPFPMRGWKNPNTKMPTTWVWTFPFPMRGWKTGYYADAQRIIIRSRSP